MLQQLEEIKLNALKELEAINNARELESWRVHYLGKKSPLTGILRSLATLPIDEKKAVGSLACTSTRVFTCDLQFLQYGMTGFSTISQAEERTFAS